MADAPPNESEKTIQIPSSADNATVNSGSPAAGEGQSGEPQVLAKFGRYEIIDEIARGGVGVVYKARQEGLNRIVALKILQGGMRGSSEHVQRFMQEARAAARLQHPNIVPIHDFGEEDGQYYFTMDYIEGESLADVVARGAIQPRDALDIVRQVADALHYAHQQGVVHRDIKPGNILIDTQQRVQVTDFGLAKEVQEKELSLTMTGQVMGTPRYMSPEQASGRTASADARSDIFSLGVTLYEMLTGQPAFAGQNVMEMLQKVLSEDPKPPHKLNHKVHRDIETICLKAMEKAPERRYQTALHLTQDIERFLSGEPIEAKPVGFLGRGFRRSRKHGKAILIYAVILFITINAIILALNARPSFVHLNVDTAGAIVKLNGLPLAIADFAKGYSLKAGQHRLRVESEPLYDPEEFEFVTKPGESRTLNVALARRHGYVTINSEPPDAGVTLVGENDYRETFQGPRVEQRLPTGEYSFLVHKENYLGKGADFVVEANATNVFDFTLLSITMWEAATSGNILSVPVVDDFNSDGMHDAVVGDDDGNIYCFSGRNGIALWVFQAGDAVQAPVSKADINRDGVADVVVGSTDARLYCLNGKNGRPLWSAQTKGAIQGPALLGDVNGDGVPDAVVGSEDQNVYAFSGLDGRAIWSFATGGAVSSCLAWSEPATENAVLVGSADQTLYCLRATTGELLWKAAVGAPLHFPPSIVDLEQNGQLAALLPTPAGAGDARRRTPVLLATHQVLPAIETIPFWIDFKGDGKKSKLVVSAGGSICYEPNGTTVRWQTPYVAVGLHLADVTGDGIKDLIFNNGPDQLVCLSGETGQAIGRITLDASVGRGYSLEDVDRDGVPDVVVGAGRKLYCFSWIGGREQWIGRSADYFDVPFVAIDQSVVSKASNGEIVCRDLGNGNVRWSLATSVQPSPYSGLGAGSGIVVDSDAQSRELRAINITSGEPVWHTRLAGKPGSAIGWPTVIGDVVLVGDGENKLHCFNLAEGTMLWQQSLGKITGRAVIDGDSLYITDASRSLYCLKRSDGSPRWAYPASDPFPSPPALWDINGDGTKDAIALCDNGFLYALNGKSGKVLWEIHLTSVRTRTRHRVVLADVDGDAIPEAILCSLKGNVVCLDVKLGKPKWIYPLRERVMSEPVIADVNADQVPDIIVGSMGRRVHCISGKGDRELWSHEVGAQIRYSAPIVVPSQSPTEAPSVLVGTGPPENGVYCLSSASTSDGATDWQGPWKELTHARTSAKPDRAVPPGTAPAK